MVTKITISDEESEKRKDFEISETEKPKKKKKKKNKRKHKHRNEMNRLEENIDFSLEEKRKRKHKKRELDETESDTDIYEQVGRKHKKKSRHVDSKGLIEFQNHEGASDYKKKSKNDYSDNNYSDGAKIHKQNKKCASLKEIQNNEIVGRNKIRNKDENITIQICTDGSYSLENDIVDSSIDSEHSQGYKQRSKTSEKKMKKKHKKKRKKTYSNSGKDVTELLSKFLTSNNERHSEYDGEIGQQIESFLGKGTNKTQHRKNKVIIKELLSIEKSLLRNQRKKEIEKLEEHQRDLEEMRSRKRRAGDQDYYADDGVIYEIDDKLDDLYEKIKNNK